MLVGGADRAARSVRWRRSCGSRSPAAPQRAGESRQAPGVPPWRRSRSHRPRLGSVLVWPELGRQHAEYGAWSDDRVDRRAGGPRAPPAARSSTRYGKVVLRPPLLRRRSRGRRGRGSSSGRTRRTRAAGRAGRRAGAGRRRVRVRHRRRGSAFPSCARAARPRGDARVAGAVAGLLGANALRRSRASASSRARRAGTVSGRDRALRDPGRGARRGRHRLRLDAARADRRRLDRLPPLDAAPRARRAPVDTAVGGRTRRRGRARGAARPRGADVRGAAVRRLRRLGDVGDEGARRSTRSAAPTRPLRRRRATAPLHLDYPLFLPALEAVAFRALGSFDPQPRPPPAPAAPASPPSRRSPRSCCGTAPPWVVWPALVALAAAPNVLLRLLTGYADLPLALFVATGLAAAGRWLVTREPFLLGLATGLFAAAALTKNEGAIFVGAAYLALLLTAWTAWRPLVLSGARRRGAAAAVAALRQARGHPLRTRSSPAPSASRATSASGRRLSAG